MANFKNCAVALAGVLAAWLSGGCRVFEDRDVCPSYLTVDMQGVDKSIREWQMWLFNGAGEMICKDTIYRRDYVAPYVIEVPRYGEVECLLWGNIRGGTELEERYSQGTTILKLEDIPSDSLYSSRSIISTNREESYLKVVPRKEFATVELYLQGWVGIDFDIEAVLRCAKGGFYVNGDFYGNGVSTRMEFSDLGNYYTKLSGRILRQPDTENILLSLFIRKREVDGSLGKVLVDLDIPIGMYLENNGYDIQSPDLSDIRLDVDYSYNQLVVKAEDWEAEYSLVEEI